MSLNKLALFKNVKITPDYSVVHDMDSDTWKDYLMGWLDPMPADANPPENVFYDEHVNYYRMPETIRIEGNYDIIRTATYGYLEDGLSEGNPGVNVSFRRIFFWVNDVRILKQFCNRDLESSPVEYKDVVELDITVDVWSSYAGKFELYDSYVERRHMPRWKNEGTELLPDWHPIYYPNAAQGVEGSYEKENIESVVKPKTFTNLAPYMQDVDVDIEIAIVTWLNKQGELHIFAFPEGHANIRLAGDFILPLYYGMGGTFKPCVGVSGALVGDALYTAMGISAEFIQSICVVKGWQDLVDHLSRGTGDIVIISNIGYAETVTINGVEYVYFVIASSSRALGNFGDLTQSKAASVTVVAPDHDAQPVDGEYLDAHEPMMYLEPARQRKVVAPLGGELFTVPDIVAFEGNIYTKNLVDMTAVSQTIGLFADPVESNAMGAIGVLQAATMPIYNSAWRSYEAISKVSDTMMFNAKQMQTVGTGVGGSALSAAGGFMMGGPGGAVLGFASGILGTVSGLYGNDVELDAKRVQIKNSPCVVKSTGSGLTNVYWGLLDAYYVTLKMDDQSMEKLRFMYYWFGYHVNRTFKGDIDLHTRTKFDFIKTSRAKVKGDLTAGAAKQIGAIFDAGVTIYHGSDGYALIGTGNMVSNDEV